MMSLNKKRKLLIEKYGMPNETEICENYYYMFFNCLQINVTRKADNFVEIIGEERVCKRFSHLNTKKTLLEYLESNCKSWDIV